MSWVEAYYDGSFGSADFWIQDPYTTAAAEEEIAEYHHPGSDDNTVIKLGQKVRKLRITVACTEADHAALVSAQGTDGTLDYFDGSVSAHLINVGEFTVNPLYDVRTGPLEFWLN